jgi:hypothetical protein
LRLPPLPPLRIAVQWHRSRKDDGATRWRFKRSNADVRRGWMNTTHCNSSVAAQNGASA